MSEAEWKNEWNGVKEWVERCERPFINVVLYSQYLNILFIVTRLITKHSVLLMMHICYLICKLRVFTFYCLMTQHDAVETAKANISTEIQQWRFHWPLLETRKSCSETNTKAALRYRSTTILKLFAEKKKWLTGGHFGFFSSSSSSSKSLLYVTFRHKWSFKSCHNLHNVMLNIVYLFNTICSVYS